MQMRTHGENTLRLELLLHDKSSLRHSPLRTGAGDWRKGEAETTEQQNAEQVRADAEHVTGRDCRGSRRCSRTAL